MMEHAFAENPHRVSHPLDPPLEGLDTVYIDAYRAVLEIDDDAMHVEVVAVGHRADIYRPGFIERSGGTSQ